MGAEGTGEGKRYNGSSYTRNLKGPVQSENVCLRHTDFRAVRATISIVAVVVIFGADDPSCNGQWSDPYNGETYHKIVNKPILIRDFCEREQIFQSAWKLNSIVAIVTFAPGREPHRFDGMLVPQDMMMSTKNIPDRQLHDRSNSHPTPPTRLAYFRASCQWHD
jgi:hypothetical protein